MAEKTGKMDKDGTMDLLHGNVIVCFDALGKALGPEEGLAELKKIPDPVKLKDYPFYPAAQGEFHLLAGRPAEAGNHFEKAMTLARSRSEAHFFERKLE